MPDRRTVISGIAALSVTPAISVQADTPPVSGLVLKSGQSLPRIGMGTWLTFNIHPEGPNAASRKDVLKMFYENGGGMIDSSPMYGQAEYTIGKMRNQKSEQNRLFSATKIWTPLDKHGDGQLADSHSLWQEPVLDLVYVHNLLNWKSHLPRLRNAKDAGNVRYIGLTTSHGRRHEELEDLISREPIDAIQLSYNILNRRTENRLLPLAKEKELTVIVNRPFMGGHLFERIAGINVPEWAQEDLEIQSWAEFFLKFVISHPSVDCAIPATGNPAHMAQNMRALSGPMPDNKQRQKMARFMAEL